MASMREIRNRINSVQDTMKITNAMYLISSSKLRKARSGYESVSPYFETLKETIADILDRRPDIEQELMETSLMANKLDEEKQKLFIVISSDKGLAGSYNHNIFKFVEEKFEVGVDNSLLLIGRMAINYFKNNKYVHIDENHIYSAAEPTVFRAGEIAEYVINEYLNTDLDEVYVIYTKMVNAMTFEPKALKVIPFTRGMFADIQTEERQLQEPVFWPSAEAVLRHIVPNYVKGLIYGAMVESYVCEQSARMAAMDNATTNAKEMIRELTLAYNRVRQAAITQEITEIVGGAQSAD